MLVILQFKIWSKFMTIFEEQILAGNAEVDQSIDCAEQKFWIFQLYCQWLVRNSDADII